MPRRVLFVIRGKLGDTVVAYATVRRYADLFPADKVTLLTRSNYAGLLSREKGVRVIGFSSRLEMIWRLLRFLTEPKFDALLVIWGFGTPIKWLGRLVRARRKIYLDDRYPRIYPEYSNLSPHRLQSEPMWRVAQIFEPALSPPVRLYIPSLAEKRRPGAMAIGIVPVADEPRRIMSPAMLTVLLRVAARRHPAAPIRVFVNHRDRGAQELLDVGLPAGVEFTFFPNLDDLILAFLELTHIYCTDTGLYALGAAMDIPATVFYGPTQPWRNVMPGQPGVRSVRLAVLGGEHCEEKECEVPVCLDGAIRAFGREDPISAIIGPPAGCPLRIFPVERLCEINQHENPDH